MDRLVYTAHMAQTEQRLDRQALTHELANVSTVGFKKALAVANRSVRVEGEGFDTRFLPRAFTTNVVDMTEGTRMLTTRPLDIAMNGRTVLGVQSESGDLAFTRRGDLRVDSSGILTTGSGRVVLDEKASPISLPLGVKLNVTDDGRIMASDPTAPIDGEVEVSRLMIKDTTGVDLFRREDGLFSPVSPIEGTADFEAGTGVASVTSGVLEGSNVSVVETMVKFIDYQRSFEMQTRVIKEMKENDASGASMMRMS